MPADMLSAVFTYMMYVIGVLALIPMLFAKRKAGYRVTAVLTGLLTCLCGLYFCVSSPNVFNHSRESYTGSFHSLVRDMARTAGRDTS